MLKPIKWFLKLFSKKWDTMSCGCKYYQGRFTPLEVEYCEKHEAEWKEWLKNRPSEPKKEWDFFDSWFPPIG